MPFIWYLDSRFSSIDAFKHLKDLGHYAVMSCPSTMAPQFLGQWLKGPVTRRAKHGYPINGKRYDYPLQYEEDLKKFSWRALYNRHMDAVLFKLRAKKDAYLTILTNASDATTVKKLHQRLKAPRVRYWVKGPRAQGEYNAHKNKVDEFNRAVLSYMSLNRTAKPEHKYVP